MAQQGPKTRIRVHQKKKEGRGKEKMAHKADSDGVITNPPSPSPSKNRGSKAEYDSSETILPKNKETPKTHYLLIAFRAQIEGSVLPPEKVGTPRKPNRKGDLPT